MYEHTYRVSKAQWGIYIKLTAEFTSMSNYDHKDSCSEICHGLWAAYALKPLVKGEKFVEEDKYFLWEGLKKVSDLILTSSPYKLDTLIIIHSMTIPLCDFQEEGLTAAIIEWAAHAFEFEVPKIDVKFNKELNKYEFYY